MKKIYKVVKIDANDKEYDYGTMCEEDMKLVTRGYKQDEFLNNLYTRKGSSAIYIVDEVK